MKKNVVLQLEARRPLKLNHYYHSKERKRRDFLSLSLSLPPLHSRCLRYKVMAPKPQIWIRKLVRGLLSIQKDFYAFQRDRWKLKIQVFQHKCSWKEMGSTLFPYFQQKELSLSSKIFIVLTIQIILPMHGSL